MAKASRFVYSLLLISGLLVAACNSSSTNNPASPETLAIRPASPVVDEASSQQLTVTNGGAPFAGPVEWRSSAPGVVSVNGNGLLTAGNIHGAATITARAAGDEALAQATVVALCDEPAPFQPELGPIAKPTLVAFVAGTDADAVTAELIATYGFEVEEILSSPLGFTAILSAPMIAGIRCHEAVDYLEPVS